MIKNSKKKSKLAPETEYIEFVPAEDVASSAEFVSADTAKVETPATNTLAPATKLEDMPPVFRELAEPRLPQLAHQNRGRLQMQSPNRLFFYWSVGPNPFHKLNKALGAQIASYTLVLKLIDLKRDFEQLYRVDAEGTWWFDVEADGEYRVEVGFYAPNRPFVRALFSNTVTTPRKSPSARVDTEADWAVSADRFAQVLEVAGFSEDAFDVAIAGDDRESSDASTRSAFSDLTGAPSEKFSTVAEDEIRYALLLLAAGVSLEGLRGRISPALFAVLQEYAASLSAEKAFGALTDHFDIESDEIVEEEFEPGIFGGSLVNFPRRLKTRRTLPKLTPVSSPGSRV